MATEPCRVLVADPPWGFKDRLPGGGRGAVKHYATMSTREIMSFLDDRPGIKVADDSLLFLWRVASMQQQALHVAESWGFTVKTEIVWVKTKTCLGCFQSGWLLQRGELIACPTCEGRGWRPHIGMGHYTRNSHETCLVARRGKGTVDDHSIPSVLFAPQTRKHSQKPEAFFAMVEQLVGGPYTELFARRRRKGWKCLGDELQPRRAA